MRAIPWPQVVCNQRVTRFFFFRPDFLRFNTESIMKFVFIFP